MNCPEIHFIQCMCEKGEHLFTVELELELELNKNLELFELGRVRPKSGIGNVNIPTKLFTQTLNVQNQNN